MLAHVHIYPYSRSLSLSLQSHLTRYFYHVRTHTYSFVVKLIPSTISTRTCRVSTSRHQCRRRPSVARCSRSRPPTAMRSTTASITRCRHRSASSLRSATWARMACSTSRSAAPAARSSEPTRSSTTMSLTTGCAASTTFKFAAASIPTVRSEARSTAWRRAPYRATRVSR